jgi:hypothetical protein
MHGTMNLKYTDINSIQTSAVLTLILPTWRIWWPPNNASKWQIGFNSAFKGLIQLYTWLFFNTEKKSNNWTDHYTSTSLYRDILHYRTLYLQEHSWYAIVKTLQNNNTNDKISRDQAPHFRAQFHISETVTHPLKAEHLLRNDVPGRRRNINIIILSRSETLTSHNCRHNLNTILRKWSVLLYRNTRCDIKSFQLLWVTFPL